jgi:Protein of unknown function (DUF2939)
MRWLIGSIAAFIVATAVYLGSAVFALNGLVAAVRTGDGNEVLARTDLQRLRHALVEQIVAAYLAKSGQKQPVKSLTQMVVQTYGASVADALVGKLLTAENLTMLLRTGRLNDSVPGIADAQLPALAQIDTSRLLDLLRRIRPVKPVEFILLLGNDANEGTISLHFEGDAWKLSGVQLTAKALQALADTLPRK